MELSLFRYGYGNDSTAGYLAIDGEFFCYTLEDEEREEKVINETCIPSGSYKIKLRTEGGMNKRYAAKYPNHQGMLWLQDVPGFEWIYIHVGNSDDETSGCILVGMSTTYDNGNHRLDISTAAYLLLYSKIIKRIDIGEEVIIEVKST